MNNKQQFLSIAGRWKQHVEASGIEKSLTPRELSMAMMMFFAGFSAALDASLEVASYAEDDAMHLLTALHTEVQQVEAMATRALSSGLAS